MSELEFKEVLEEEEEEVFLQGEMILEGNPFDKGDLESSNKSEAFKEGAILEKEESDLPSFPSVSGRSNGRGSISH